MTTRRKPHPDDVVTRGGLTRADIERGGILATPEQAKAFALGTLQMSRDAEHDAPIFPEGDITIEMLARTAGVRVTYAHVELGHACTVEYRTVQP
jgi:hypothetical protein